MFYETVITAESRKNECIPVFSDRLPLGEMRVINLRLLQAVFLCFLSFPVTVKLGLLGNGLFIL